MKEKLTNNLGLKIMSVVLAVFMWLIMVNVSNPLVEDSQEVPVEMLNEEILEKSNLTYDMIGKKTVTVYYEVRVRDRYKITSSDFYASADLAELYDVTGSVPVKVEVANRSVKSLIEGTPTTKPGVVRIQTEAMQRKRFDLTAHAVGEPGDGFALGDITLNPQYVYATGAVSDIGKINSLGVEVNVEGANADMSDSAPVCFYDANGNKLSLEDDVKLSLESVDYHVTILKVKSLALDFQVSGVVEDGYRFTGVKSDISSVAVEGLKSTLASISMLTVPKELLSVEGATGDVAVAVDIAALLPSNIKIANNAEAIAHITLKVERLAERDVECSLENLEIIGEREGYSYTFGDTVLNLEIRGLAEDLDMFQDSDAQLSVDVSELEPGLQPITFKIALSDGFELVGHGPMMVLVSDENASQEDDAADSGSTRKTAE